MANNDRTATLKQKLFAQEYVKRKGNGRQSALAVYDTKKKNAHVLANQLLKKPAVQREIKMIMDEVGLDLESGSKVLRRIIDRGSESDRITASDALKGLDMMYKLHNAYPASKSIKLSYSKTEQVASKDMTAVLEELKKLNNTTSSLIEASK